MMKLLITHGADLNYVKDNMMFLIDVSWNGYFHTGELLVES